MDFIGSRPILGEHTLAYVYLVLAKPIKVSAMLLAHLDQGEVSVSKNKSTHL